MKLKPVILYLLLFAQLLQAKAQPFKTFTVSDSLHNLLNYFYENTNDTGLKQSIEKAQALIVTDSITGSLAYNLIAAENRILELIGDSLILNRHPFQADTTIAFGNLLVNMFELLPHAKENLLYTAALNNLGRLIRRELFYDHDDIPRACALFEKARLMRKTILGENNLLYAESLGNCSLKYEWKGDIEQAKKIRLQSLAIFRNIGAENSRPYAENLYMLANLYKGLKNYDSSLLLYDLMAETWKKVDGAESSHYALWLCNTGEMIMYLWQYQKAFTYYHQALALTEKTIGKNNIQYAYCLEGMAGYYYIVADYEKAVPLYLESLAIKEKLYGKDYYDIALTLHNLATTYFRMGRYEQALPYLQRVISLNEKAGAIPGVDAYELNWQGLLYQSIGNYEKALYYYNQAIKIPEYKNANTRYAGTLNNMASVYASLGENKQALAYLEEARSIIKNTVGEQSPDYATNLYTTSILNEKLNRYSTALQSCSNAMLIRKKIYGEMHPQYALCLSLLGMLYLDIKKTDAAEYYLTHALAIQEHVLGTKHPDYIQTLNKLALLKAALNDCNAAANLLTASNKLALDYINTTYTSLSENEKIQLEADQYYQFSYLPSLIYKNHMSQPEILQQAYANELALKGMVLNNQQALLNSIRNSNDTTTINLYNEWRANKIYIGRQLLQPVKERSHHLDSVQKITNQQEQQLSRISATFRPYETLTAKAIADNLHEGEAAVEFIRFQYYNKKYTDSILYAALVVSPEDSVPEFIPLFEEKQLAGLFEHFTNSEKAINRFFSSVPGTKNYLQVSGDSLYALAWKPLEKALEGIHTVYYAPTGLLHRLAFAALPYNTTGSRLINQYNLVQLLSTRSVAMPSAAEQKPSGINIWGNIQYTIPYDATAYTNKITERGVNNKTSSDIRRHANDATTTRTLPWPPLPGTKLETDSIAAIFMRSGLNVVFVSDTSATEKNFKALDGISPQVLHIATHGFFWPVKKASVNNAFSLQQDPMFRSGLVLAGANNADIKNDMVFDAEDGILTAYEIAQMDLSETEIVVLSACETALGDLQNNEGVIGLQRAFKLAGVKQVMVSLWRVPDEQTAELMRLFYTNWLEGQSPPAALRTAQLLMQLKYPPYDWAGFVLAE